MIKILKRKSLIFISLLLGIGGIIYLCININRLCTRDDSLASARYSQKQILENLVLLTPQEKSELDALFRELFLRSGFAYTLFDERPMAFTAYFTKTPYENIHAGFLYPPIAKWWDTWEKYKHLFPLTNFQFIITQDDEHNSVRIYFINLKLYNQFIEKAQPNTRWVINSGKSVQELKQILKEFQIEQLPNYIELLGILLGYGENNSYLFYRRDEIEKMLSGNNKSYEEAFINGHLNKLQEELNQINKKLVSIKYPQSVKRLELIYPPTFLVDKGTLETRRIIKQFTKAHKRITGLYSHNDFLEITLEKLIFPN
jgi:hypothetical protein